MAKTRTRDKTPERVSPDVAETSQITCPPRGLSELRLPATIVPRVRRYRRYRKCSRHVYGCNERRQGPVHPWPDVLDLSIHYNILGRGGHFAAWEQPALHAKEVRDCFAKVRRPRQPNLLDRDLAEP